MTYFTMKRKEGLSTKQLIFNVKAYSSKNGPKAIIRYEILNIILHLKQFIIAATHTPAKVGVAHSKSAIVSSETYTIPEESSS